MTLGNSENIPNGKQLEAAANYAAVKFISHNWAKVVMHKVKEHEKHLHGSVYMKNIYI